MVRTGRYSEAYPAVAGSVARVRRAIVAHAERLGATPEVAADVALAVSEAATNAVVHAYRDHRDPGRILASARRVGDMLEIVIADEGMGMMPRTDSPGLGLGLPVIAAVASHVEVGARRRGGTRLAMHFPVDRAASA